MPFIYKIPDINNRTFKLKTKRANDTKTRLNKQNGLQIKNYYRKMRMMTHKRIFLVIAGAIEVYTKDNDIIPNR